ncbi:MAG TPA: HAMP domain-containing histidine kinase [Candidatus Ruania gallistercoris]|uniref:histidine kinase n=1 Tax=Candidatus Ruania gallistercoris TaxID=2838746 RepID=A0A9D2EBN4_9MICO|nr:HAMP domain-containing histidine kinase [Candidatus Ruania gallistercoris]
MTPEHYTSARLRLALSYAIFLVAAGAVVLVAVYVVLHQVPNYPLTASNPRDRPVAPSRQEILQTLVVLSAVVLAGLAVIGVGGGWVLAGWVLRPLRQINAAAQIAAAGDLSHRIQLAGRNDEFRQVADSFDLMLDRLQESFEIRERFAANASHELRTPLTVTATLLEVAERDPQTRTDPELLARLTRSNTRAVALVDALLRMAAAEHSSPPAPADLAELARAALAEHAGAAVAAGLHVEERLEAARMSADPDLIGQVALNLVQNAIRHNLAEVGWIWVRTATEGGCAVLTVANTGTELTAAEAHRLREPFLRGAGRTAGTDSSAAGHGLGLSIVDRIVRAHGGRLDLQPRVGGGLVATVMIPRLDGRTVEG